MTSDRLRFGAFLAPHHPLGEHPTLLLRRGSGPVTTLRQIEQQAQGGGRRPGMPAPEEPGA